SHRRGRHGGGRRGRVAPMDPFLAPEEEQLVAVRVVPAGQQHWAAQMETELVKREGVRPIREPRVATSVARPAVGVELGVAIVLQRVTVELLRATLGDETNLPGRCTPVLGAEIRGQ